MVDEIVTGDNRYKNKSIYDNYCSQVRSMSEVDFEIERLPGECKFDSPLQECTSFVQESEKILLNPIVNTKESSVEGRTLVELAGPRSKLYFPSNDPDLVAGIVTCGGLCPGLNNVIQALVNSLYFRYGVKKILGFRYGYEGLVKGLGADPVWLVPNQGLLQDKGEQKQQEKLFAFESWCVKDIHRFGGTILGSSRGPQSVTLMVDRLEELKVRILFTIGGDGTQKGASAMVSEIRKRTSSTSNHLPISIVGLPKTIDNDLLHVEETFGFQTACQLALQAIQGVHEEARACRYGIGIVKLMGRDSGFIALQTSLASSEVNILLVPEVLFSVGVLERLVRKRLEQRGHAVIVVSEGAGQDLFANDASKKDASGNVKYADIGTYLRDYLADHFKANPINNDRTTGSVSVKYIDPSYGIRSAPANSQDAVYSLMLGQMAVHGAMAGRTNFIVGRINHKFVHLPIEACVRTRKRIDVKGLLYQALLDNTGMPLSLV